MSAKAVDAIRAECKAQMQAFRDYGFKSKHFDSHMWCSCNLPVWKALEPLISEYGFETTRSLRGHRLDSIKSVKKVYTLYVENLMRKKLQINEQCSVRGSELISAVNNKAIKENDLVELQVHPILIDGVSTDYLFSTHATTNNKDCKPVEEVVKIASSLGILYDP